MAFLLVEHDRDNRRRVWEIPSITYALGDLTHLLFRCACCPAAVKVLSLVAFAALAYTFFYSPS
jgi:hypothetical protein